MIRFGNIDYYNLNRSDINYYLDKIIESLEKSANSIETYVDHLGISFFISGYLLSVKNLLKES